MFWKAHDARRDQQIGRAIRNEHTKEPVYAYFSRRMKVIAFQPKLDTEFLICSRVLEEPRFQGTQILIDYFAYGSNMNLPHLWTWLQSFGVEPEGISNPRHVVLPNYRFRTNYLTTRRLGAANIEPSPGDSVEGVLITISSEVRMALNSKEGFPTRYDEIEIKVIDASSDRKITAFTYQVTPHHRLPFDVPVSMRYRRLILEGSKAAQLSDAYQSHLREILKTPAITNRIDPTQHDDRESNDTSEDSHTRCA